MMKMKWQTRSIPERRGLLFQTELRNRNEKVRTITYLGVAIRHRDGIWMYDLESGDSLYIPATDVVRWVRLSEIEEALALSS